MARARKRANVSLAEIATAWGCSPSNVAHALAGRQSVSAEQLEAFARSLGVSVASLYGEARR
jgi:transcriptional regulator with XRE-family HTH domain